MGRASVPEALRALGAVGGTSALAVALGTALPDRLTAALAPHAPVDTMVLAAVLVVAALAAAALAAGCCALGLAALVRTTGRPAAALDQVARALTPAVLRRVVAVGVGAGLGLGGALTATAAETDLGWQPTAGTLLTAAAGTVDHAPPSTAVDVPAQASVAPGAASTGAPGAVPTARPTSLSAATTAPSSATAETTTVRPGDTLWSLAAARLGDDPDDADVAAAWPRWHEVNRDVIGPDPDLLLPGQVLTVPAAPAADAQGRSGGTR